MSPNTIHDEQSFTHGPSVLGPLSLGLSIGLQIMMAALVLLGSARGPSSAEQLTPYAKRIASPEYDLVLFPPGLLLTLALGLAAVAWWSHSVRQVPEAQRARFIRISALLQGGLAAASLVAFTGLLSTYWFSHDAPGPQGERWGGAWESWRMLLPAAMAAVCAAFDLKFGCGRPAVAPGSGRRRIRAIGLVAFPVFIALVVGIPPASWADVAGQFLLNDRLHHVNYFVVGPALSFAHGRAFGTEIYSQYGIAWPLLLSKWSCAWVGRYGAFVGIEVVSACLYFSGLFLLLWSVFRRVAWAAIGVLLAINWQLFSGVSVRDLIWMTPSSTMMRHPMDVVFFLALIQHRRSRRTAWIVLAGAASALGIFFQAETGSYLIATFGFYWLLERLNLLRGGRSAERGAHLRALGVFAVTVGAVLLPLLFHASRGALFTRSFVPGWLESLASYSVAGIGAMPLSMVPDAPLVFFLMMTATYVAAIGYAVVRSLQGRAHEHAVVSACFSAYGLALMLLFVGRSHPFNLCHVAVPFAVVATMLSFEGVRRLSRWLPRSSFAPVLAGGLALLLLTDPDFLRYPSLLGLPLRAAPAPSLSLVSDPVDLSGLPPAYEFSVNTFEELSSAIRSAARDGSEVAILDIDDTLFYQGADVAPWHRYTSLFTMMLTQQSVQDLQRELVERSPGIVVMRDHVAPPTFDFVWNPLRELVRTRYELSQTIGEFEIWRRRVGVSAG